MRRPALLSAFVLVAGCHDAPTAAAPDDPTLSIEDAVNNGGNEHFFWLPPMVASPGYAGSFDGTRAPVVHICEWDGAACVLPLVAEFTTTSGPGAETVRVELADEHYVVNWHTDQFALDDQKTYRIIARVDDQNLGHADVDVVSNGSQLKSVDTGEFIPLKDGRTLPIKFRIEEGAIEEGFRWASVTAGEAHSCGLDTSGAAYCWGWNAAGQLGIPPTTGTGGMGSSTVPVAVTGGVAFLSVDAGEQFNCGISLTGAGYCWGTETGDGNLGTTDPPITCIGGRVCIFTPTAIQGGLALGSASAGFRYACALTVSDEPYCWGRELGGSLASTSVPSPLGGGPWTFTQIRVDAGVACGLEPGGDAYCWGFSNEGQVGDGTLTNRSSTPQAVVGGLKFSTLAVGGFHACGLEVGTGLAYCWGSDGWGSLGRGTLGAHCTSTPLPVAGLTFASLAAGRWHTCGVTTGGQMYCWGRNGTGELGDGSAPDGVPHPTPVQVLDPVP